MNKEKIFYIDVETTGLNSTEAATHQLSAIIEIDGKVEEELNLYIAPFPGASIAEAALNVSGVNEQTIKGYPPESEAMNTILTTINKHCSGNDISDRFHICGFNNRRFDNLFFRSLWNRNLNLTFDNYFTDKNLDVYLLAAGPLRNVRHTMTNFKLNSVAKAFSIELEESKLHDAKYDIYLTREIFLKIRKISNI